ncbi:hypothetical protein MNBD_ALPHA12-1527 [hydrothermal vent metagenome]|uniref:Cell wall hydrolase SleB domain-containing protein n=1 Tax=hydrothermal vent metagenome TaxID=652676 RepID=A0A3B0USU4_9ZZZZ
MAQKFRPAGSKNVRRKNIAARLVSISAISATSYMLMLANANGPAFNPDLQTPPLAVGAIVPETGSPITDPVNIIFQSATFVGPNRSLKTNRMRPEIDVIELSRSFNKARLRLAQLRASEPAQLDPLPQNSGLNIAGITAMEIPAPISIAAVDPALASAALAAIAKATPLDPSVPRPNVISSKLAYARAVAPTTQRELNRYSERDRWCLSSAIYFEARGESYRGQVAVAQVVMNRVKHPLYPDTICGVVFQNQSWRDRCQFSFACDGKPERVTEPKAWARAQEITQKVTTGKIYLSEVANATHYHANYVHPSWAKRMERVTAIGTHIFYRFRS